MSWTTAVDDLRALISDQANDRHAYRKRVFGQINGVNTTFKTFETRRVATMVGAIAPLGAFVDGVSAAVSADNILVGEFELAVAPSDGSVVEATYYYQWFLDNELLIFLKNATQWIGIGEDHTKVASGLQPAALHFAAQEAYHKIAVRWAERWSEMYLLEDRPAADNDSIVDTYRNLSKDFRMKAEALRAGFYGRNDQANAPLFGSVVGNVRDLKPQR